MAAQRTTVTLITKAIVELHNCLMSLNLNDNYIYFLTNFVDQKTPSCLVEGERKKEESILGLRHIGKINSNNYLKKAKEIRNSFKEYFNEQGQVERH